MFDVVNSPMKIDDVVTPRKGKPLKPIAWADSPMRVDEDYTGKRRSGRVDHTIVDSPVSPMKVDKVVAKPKKASAMKELYVDVPQRRTRARRP